MDTVITLTLHDPLLRAARDVAAAREITVQQLLKDALNAELARAHRQAKSPVRADERLIAMLRARFAGDFAYAGDWYDLIRRLRDQGVCLREAGGGLALFSLASGARLCKASDIGFSLNKLARRFRAPFPGEKLGLRAFRPPTTRANETGAVDGIDF